MSSIHSSHPLESNSTEQLSQYWLWNNDRIHYVQMGTQGPKVLLVHGFGASTDHWRKNIEALSQSCQVWAIDLLGFGRSQKPRIVYSVQVWVDQLLAFCEQVIKAPIFIAGNSLGGYGALCFAVAQPQWVQGLILLNCAGPFSNAKPLPKSSIQSFRARFLKRFFQAPGVIEGLSFFSFLYFRRRSQIRKTLLKVYKNPAAVTEQLVEDIYRPSLDIGALGVFSSVFKAPPGETLDELLAKLDRPLALIWGQADPWMSQDKAEKFVQYYPDAHLTLIDAGHCPHDECPDTVNEAMLNWIQAQAKT